MAQNGKKRPFFAKKCIRFYTIPVGFLTVFWALKNGLGAYWYSVRPGGHLEKPDFGPFLTPFWDPLFQLLASLYWFQMRIWPGGAKMGPKRGPKMGQNGSFWAIFGLNRAL